MIRMGLLAATAVSPLLTDVSEKPLDPFQRMGAITMMREQANKIANQLTVIIDQEQLDKIQAEMARNIGPYSSMSLNAKMRDLEVWQIINDGDFTGPESFGHSLDIIQSDVADAPGANDETLITEAGKLLKELAIPDADGQRAATWAKFSVMNGEAVKNEKDSGPVRQPSSPAPQ